MYLDSALTIFNLSMIQLVWGMFLGALSTGRISSFGDIFRFDRMINDLPSGIIWLYPTKSTQVFSAVCHAIGGFSLNLCYLFSSVFIVQVLKSAEPVATLTLGVFILNEVFNFFYSNTTSYCNRINFNLIRLFFILKKPSFQLVCSVLTIIIGVAAICFRDSTISIYPIMIAMLSNFVLPMRNVLSKKIMINDGLSTQNPSGENRRLLDNASLGKGSEHSEENPPSPIVTPPPASKKASNKEGNPAESFYLTSLIAAYFMLPFWAIVSIYHYQFLIKVYSYDIVKYVMLSGLMHASYNLSSFGFLSRVSTPTTHAIANVFKRVFTIWSAIMFFGNTDSSMSTVTVVGLAISTIGLFWYGNITANTKKG
jgi:hypothetical protein